MEDFKKLWSILSKRRHKQFYLILILMILSSLAEVVSIGAVIPFLGVFSSPDLVYQHSIMQPINHMLAITEPEQLLLPITVFFIIAVLISTSIRLVLLYVMTRFSYAAGADLSIDIYRRTLYQEYKTHISINSSELINSIINKTTGVIRGVIAPVLTIISSTFLISLIMVILFTIDFSIAFITSIGLGLLYFGIIRMTRHRLKENSKCIAKESTEMIKALQEGLGGIRDVLLNGSQEFYCNMYRNADTPLRKASGDNIFIVSSPRYIIESLGMILIAFFAYHLGTQEDSMDLVIPILGSFALGAQKLMPALQQVYNAYGTIKGGYASFEDVLKLLSQQLPAYINDPLSSPMIFKEAIKIQNIGFRYTKKDTWVLRGINLTLEKGSITGIIGKTGSGKSTILDLVMGLHKPSEGKILIDNTPLGLENMRSWQSCIAHVPQSIFLIDGTIEQNIAFGVSKDKIDHKRVRQSAKQANISKMVGNLNDGYSAIVGERGAKLSGGQRQRIGIARALYKGASVLIFDEATSALDNETETQIMKEIEALDKNITILIIAHRLSTLKNCDQIIRLDESGVSIVHYSELTS